VRLFIVLIGAVGLTLIGWGVWTLRGGDPVTAAIQHRSQHGLRRLVVRQGGCHLHRGVVGILRIPKIALNQVVVQGTSKGELAKGPGHYAGTALPGHGRAIAIAGHRTTWGAPFRHLDTLRRGDTIFLCGFRYRVTIVYVVQANDWRILKGRGERLILTTCHPVYSASHRLVVKAVPADPPRRALRLRAAAYFSGTA
jgi:LPXTG-site transpeptidase (sortase) family protein